MKQIGDDLIPQDPHVGTECVVMFRVGETTQEHKYSTMFGNAKGSARLQRPPPSLTPSRGALRKDIVSERTMAHNVWTMFNEKYPNLQGVGNSTVVLSVENDNDFRSRCE